MKVKTEKISKRALNLINHSGAISTAMRRLIIFAAQNPGFDPANYGGCASAYRSDSRQAQKAWREFYDLVWHYNIERLSNDDLQQAGKQAFSGRLEWNGKEWDYCTGQYFPTEYRWAAVAVLKAALFNKGFLKIEPE